MTDDPGKEPTVWLRLWTDDMGVTHISGGARRSEREARQWASEEHRVVEYVPVSQVAAAVAESRARTFRAAITYVTGDLRTPHPDADAEAEAFAAAVRERIAAAVEGERARIRARVEALTMERCWPAVEGCHGTLMQRDDALRATEGGAP